MRVKNIFEGKTFSSFRLSPTFSVTCWTQWALRGKCFNIWTGSRRWAPRGRYNPISWEETSASAPSTLPILLVPKNQCFRWGLNNNRSLHSSSEICIKHCAVQLPLKHVLSLLRTCLWSWSQVRWRRWSVRLEKGKAPVWVCWSVSTSHRMEKSSWIMNHWNHTSIASSTRRFVIHISMFLLCELK